MRDGGYLLAVLPPEHQVLTDGRFAGLGGEAEHALVTPADLARLDGRYRFGSVVVPYARAGYEALLRELRRNPLWIPVQLDAVSLLFVRRASLPPGNRPLDLATVALPPPGPEATRAGRRSALRAARQLYAALDRPAEALVADSALAEFERFGSDRETPPDLMRAQLLARLGRADETHIEIARLAREQPRNVWQRTTLGNLELKLGDLAAARGHYEAAVASDASYSPARERLEGLEELDRLRSSGDRAAVRRAHRRLARLALPPQALPETPRTRLRAENAVGPLLGSGLGLLALLGAKRRAGAPSLRR
jgi:tetratricopeptide (TPR) repeat protein